jgi:hypothetical protein
MYSEDEKMSRSSTYEETFKIRFRINGIVKTSFVVAKDHHRAKSMARNYPNVLSVSKASNDYIRIERSELKTFSDKVIEETKPLTALQMDEFIWMRRNKRIENKQKDHIDNVDK